MAWGAFMLIATAAVQPMPELLACKGSAVGAVATGSTSAIVRDSYGNVVTGNSVDTEVRQIDGVIQLRLNGDDPRANMPRIFAPEIASSKGGWYRIKDLVVTDDLVRGKVVFNFLTSSRFEIDRRTGILTSENGFQAACEAVEVSERKF